MPAKCSPGHQYTLNLEKILFPKIKPIVNNKEQEELFKNKEDNEMKLQGLGW